jgi:hypothetical protein
MQDETFKQSFIYQWFTRVHHLAKSTEFGGILCRGAIPATLVNTRRACSLPPRASIDCASFPWLGIFVKQLQQFEKRDRWTF